MENEAHPVKKNLLYNSSSRNQEIISTSCLNAKEISYERALFQMGEISPFLPIEIDLSRAAAGLSPHR
jgi:hypothetical protein